MFERASTLFLGMWLWVLGLSSFVPATAATGPHPHLCASRQTGEPSSTAEAQILENHFLLLWTGLGAIGGGYVSAAVKSIRLKQLKQVDPSLSSRLGIVVYATVGTITSICVSPWLVKRFVPPGANGNGIEAVPLVSFLVAFAIWFVLEVAEILFTRIRDRAKKDGLGGIRDELTGRLAVGPETPGPVQEKPKP
jgi:dipeptide/tripeptide permease